jgi:hypothetical protein
MALNRNEMFYVNWVYFKVFFFMLCLFDLVGEFGSFCNPSFPWGPV